MPYQDSGQVQPTQATFWQTPGWTHVCQFAHAAPEVPASTPLPAPPSVDAPPPSAEPPAPPSRPPPPLQSGSQHPQLQLQPSPVPYDQGEQTQPEQVLGADSKLVVTPTAPFPAWRRTMVTLTGTPLKS